MEKYLYLLINAASLLVPFLASFYPKHPFYKHWGNYFKANLLVASFFVIWDIFFTSMGVWGFNPHYLTGYRFYNLPVEEVMFFFFIPYSSVFIYFALQYLLRANPLVRLHRGLSLLLAIGLGVAGLFYYDRWYTASTFLLCSAFLFYNYAAKNDLSRVYLSYGFVLPFFFLVNGVLTGTGLESPVVWYDNAENLGWRMGTIPVEDAFYGFLLIASIIQLFEYFNHRKSSAIPS